MCPIGTCLYARTSFKPINAQCGQQQPDNLLKKSIRLPLRKSISVIEKKIEGEMLIRTLPITFPQIFCKFILDFQDDNSMSA